MDAAVTTVFIHGLGQNDQSWKSVCECLAPDARYVCPDLFSLPELASPLNYSALYRAFSAYCSALPAPLRLCGLSLGGVLALQYALEHPQCVAALALLGVQYKMPARLLGLQNFVFRRLPEARFAEFGLSKEDFIALSLSMATLDFSARLSELACETTIVCGSKDRVNRPASKRMAALIPGAAYFEVPGAGHELNVDAPRALAELLGIS